MENNRQLKLFTSLVLLVMSTSMFGCKESNKRQKNNNQGDAAVQQQELQRNCENAGRVWSNGRCLPNTQTMPNTEEECRTRPGFTWSNGQCIAQNQTQILTQQQCVAAGRQWVNGSCLEAGNADAQCRNTNVVSGAMSCLNARIAHIENAMRQINVSQSWLSQARDDVTKLKNHFQKLQERQISENSNFSAKTMACLDLTRMQFSASQLRRRVDGASPEQPNLLRDTQTLHDTVKTTKSAVGCII